MSMRFAEILTSEKEEMSKTVERLHEEHRTQVEALDAKHRQELADLEEKYKKDLQAEVSRGITLIRPTHDFNVRDILPFDTPSLHFQLLVYTHVGYSYQYSYG
jgi:hypothetical protein